MPLSAWRSPPRAVSSRSGQDATRDVTHGAIAAQRLQGHRPIAGKAQELFRAAPRQLASLLHEGFRLQDRDIEQSGTMDPQGLQSVLFQRIVEELAGIRIEVGGA